MGDLLECSGIITIDRELNHEMSIMRWLHDLDILGIHATELLIEVSRQRIGA